MQQTPSESPCRACGACCAATRVSFHEVEVRGTGGTVPRELTAPLALAAHRFMRGTAGTSPRCVALDGRVGAHTTCTIYADRPSVCREMVPSWHGGAHNPWCDAARIAHGLAPLEQAPVPLIAR